MSMGWPRDPSIDSWVSQMIGFGYTLSVAAGNDNVDACNVSPARVSEVSGALKMVTSGFNNTPFDAKPVSTGRFGFTTS